MLVDRKQPLKPLPTIDHSRQQKKLEEIIGMCTETNELQFRNGKNNSSAKQTVLKESQDVANGRMSRDSYYKTKKEETKATKETVESLKQQRRRLASHQAVKEVRNSSDT